MNRKTFVITEGESDRLLLQALLGMDDQETNVRIVAAGGWSSADSLARSILMRGTNDVALVVDADALDPYSIQERRQFLHRSLGEIVSPGKREIIVIAPEIDAVLFMDRSILEAIVGRPVDEEKMLQGKLEPTRVLKELLHDKTPVEAFKLLPNIDLSPILHHAAIQQLHRFLQNNRQRIAA